MAQIGAALAQIVGRIVRCGALATATTAPAAAFALGNDFGVRFSIAIVMLDRAIIGIRIAFEAVLVRIVPVLVPVLVIVQIVFGILLGAQGCLFGGMLGLFAQ